MDISRLVQGTGAQEAGSRRCGYGDWWLGAAVSGVSVVTVQDIDKTTSEVKHSTSPPPPPPPASQLPTPRPLVAAYSTRAAR